MKERTCLLNSDLLPSFRRAGRQDESSKWSWQVGAKVWTDGKGEQLRKQIVKCRAWVEKQLSFSVQDWIRCQDLRHVEDLRITYDVRLPESTLSGCGRKKADILLRWADRIVARRSWKKGGSLARRLKGDALNSTQMRKIAQRKRISSFLCLLWVRYRVLEETEGQDVWG